MTQRDQAALSPLRFVVGASPFPAFVAVILAAGSARATSGFPSQIKAELQAPTVMGCQLCHTTTAGGGPVTQPFGEAMVARGLRPGNDTSLATALRALEAEGTDSDGDGVGDIEELRQGLDPNFDGDADGEPPAFGCGAQVVPQAPSGPLPVALGLGMALVLLARRRAAR